MRAGLIVLLLCVLFGQARAEVAASPSPEPAQQGNSPSPSPPSMSEQPDIEQQALEMRDPFKRPFVAGTTVAAPLSELENFGVDQFKMVGVITGADRLRAILLDPSGKSHFVSEKMRIGTRKGYIREIRSDQIVIREKIINAIGREEALDTEIRLPPETAPAASQGSQSTE